MTASQTMSSELSSVENPQKWRFTWESQSHIPTLRLFVFDSFSNPSIRCRNIRVHVTLPRSILLLSWSDSDSGEVSLRVPIPRVLIDGDAPVSFKALDDHIEVKFVLLLPVGHPLVSGFCSILDGEISNSDSSGSLPVNSDIQTLSSSGGVHFYCRNCTYNLTRSPLREFVEMPSVNWREVADNWFGACCCSFGGISEKLVNRFANSYSCEKGTCLLDFATITICKDDLAGCDSPDSGGTRSHKAKSDFGTDPDADESKLSSRSNDACNEELEKQKHKEHVANIAYGSLDEESNNDLLSRMHLESDHSESGTLIKGCCAHHAYETSPENQKLALNMEISENQKPFLNGLLGSIFMVKSSNLSRDVKWVEYLCPHCSTLLGAYPCAGDSSPTDNGVRLFKCYISTSLLIGSSEDFFRKYTLETMFTNQLLDIAKDELSYRTVIRDLRTKIPMLHLVLVNTNSWSYTGYCLRADSCRETVLKIELQRVIKVLYTECSSNTESEMRTMEDRIKKGLVDEVFMLRLQIEHVIESLASAQITLPASCSSLQGLSLSSLKT